MSLDYMDFWSRAATAALGGLCANPQVTRNTVASDAAEQADRLLVEYVSRQSARAQKEEAELMAMDNREPSEDED